jgi:hypothetical protein
MAQATQTTYGSIEGINFAMCLAEFLEVCQSLRSIDIDWMQRFTNGYNAYDLLSRGSSKITQFEARVTCRWAYPGRLKFLGNTGRSLSQGEDV